MRALLLLALLAGAAPTRADSFSAGGPAIPTVTTFDQLPPNPSVGTLAYVRDCRALVLSAGILSLQAAGTGTGCMAAYSGSAWQIDGTAIPVAR